MICFSIAARPKSLQFLLQHLGCNPNKSYQHPQDKRSALCRAAFCQDVEMTRVLLAYGADPLWQHPEKSYTPRGSCMYAAKRAAEGNAAMLQYWDADRHARVIALLEAAERLWKDRIAFWKMNLA
jgi:hypothetical protein